MKVRIQSKSGKFNALYDVELDTLLLALQYFRWAGGYLFETAYGGGDIAVPFEEIEYISREEE
jgi:hypothetical protein